MLRRVSLLGLWLEPLVSILWSLFIVWTVFIAFLWSTGIGEAQLDSWVQNINLRHSLVLLCKLADAIWIALAAACAYLSVAETHGVDTARRWALMVFAVVGVFVATSVWTTWPLGPVFYSQRLGMRLGPVPAGIPLLWLVIILGGRAVVMRLSRAAGHGMIALGTGICAVVTAWNLEPLASRARAWWFWYSPETRAPIAPPLQNYLTWFIAAAVIAALLREPKVIGSKPEHADRLIAILGMLNGVFLLAHIAGAIHK